MEGVTITDKDIAQVCVDTYDTRVAWLQQWSKGGIFLYATKVKGTLVIAFRGSTTPQDWCRDFMALPLVTKALGVVHAGFYLGMPEAYMEVLDLVKESNGNFVVTGHSLGAAEALILSGLLVKNEYKPLAVITFGCPKPGFYELSKMLVDSGVVIRCYRNSDDPVSLVPGVLPSWMKPVKDTMMYVPSIPEDRTPLRFHHMPLYFTGTPARPVTGRGDWTL